MSALDHVFRSLFFIFKDAQRAPQLEAAFTLRRFRLTLAEKEKGSVSLLDSTESCLSLKIDCIYLATIALFKSGECHG
jgi:hypothetical protein